MAGPWVATNLPKRPGSYTNFQSQPRQSVLPPSDGIIALPITHDWGPFKQVVEVHSLGEFQDIFGANVHTPGYIAAYQAFKGEGINGSGGASTVLVYRMGASAAAKAAITLKNSNSAANALTLTARYQGTKGNNLRVEIQNNVNDATKDDLIIYDGVLEIERWPYTDAGIAGLAATVNAKSGFVTATVLQDGFALTDPGSSDSLTGGNDGTTLLSGDWTTMMTAFESHRFGIFVPFDLTDSTIRAALVTWIQGLNNSGKRVLGLIGGGTIGAPDTMSAATARTAAINNENVANAGGFVVTDDEITDTNNVVVTLTPSTFAPRIAGVIAARGDALAIDFARFADVNLVTGPTGAEILSAIDDSAGAGGVITIAKDSHPLAPVRIELGLTTYTSDSDQKPKRIYGNLHFVRIMQSLEMIITEFAENNVVGRLPVNDSTREYVLGAMKSLLLDRENEGALVAGSTVEVDQNPPPTDTDNFVKLVYTVTFSRTLRQVLNTVVTI